MKKYFYITSIILLVLLITNCSSRIENENSARNDTNKVFIANDISLKFINFDANFSINNLTSFKDDTINWDERTKFYKEIDKNTFFKIWNDSTNFNSNEFTKMFFYSLQNRNSDFIEFTTLSHGDENYCSTITYWIFNKNGTLIDKFIASQNCGDGGWYYKEKGKFTDNNTYEKVCIDTEMIGNDSIDNKEIIEEKINIIKYIISKNGKVTEQKNNQKIVTRKLK